LRGQNNVQGATDHAVLEHILPGYLKVPTPAQNTLALYNAANYNAADTVEPSTPYTVRGVATNPISLHWWKNGTKYITSLLKAWWPAINHNVSYSYLPKKTANYTILSMFDGIHNDLVPGAIFIGENPAVSDPDSEHVRETLEHLDWLVCVDPYETETAAFWKRPGATPGAIGTTVYLLPAAVGIEKYGSFSDSGRWPQWAWRGGNPPGYTPSFAAGVTGAKPDMDILTELGKRLKVLIADAPVANLNWPCFNYTGQTDDALAELIAKEMHGYFIDGSGNTTGLCNTFIASLTETGTTACGNWLHCGMFAAPLDAFETANQGAIWPLGGVGNRAKRRYPIDVGNLGYTDPGKLCAGLYSYWAWCWPVNRRIVYNRAGMYISDGFANYIIPPAISPAAVQAGDPLAPNKYVLKWNGTGFSGDVVDGGGNPAAGTWPYPFIMNKDGAGHLFGGWSMAEGPFPWHYEPAESPIAYPGWLGAYRMNPTVHLYTGSAFATHGDPTFNIFATSYRLTEHYHTGTMTRNSPRLNELQPEPFIEMSEELAKDTTAIPSGPIANGDMVTVASARGSITVKACVTKRFKPFQVNGTTVHQIGVLWHWGYMGLSTGDSGNVLTPYIGDANTRIPESKCFRVNIVKV